MKRALICTTAALMSLTASPASAQGSFYVFCYVSYNAPDGRLRRVVTHVNRLRGDIVHMPAGDRDNIIGSIKYRWQAMMSGRDVVGGAYECFWAPTEVEIQRTLSRMTRVWTDRSLGLQVEVEDYYPA